MPSRLPTMRSNPQGLAVVPLSSVEVVGVFFGIGECVEVGGDIPCLAAQAAVKLDSFAIGHDGGGIILCQLVPHAAQAAGSGPLVGVGLCLTPMGFGAMRAGQHLGRLLAELVNPMFGRFLVEFNEAGQAEKALAIDVIEAAEENQI